jgi:hypothetical protein
MENTCALHCEEAARFPIEVPKPKFTAQKIRHNVVKNQKAFFHFWGNSEQSCGQKKKTVKEGC